MQGSLTMNIVIFTDLDGSLLNHDDYSFEEARSSLARIKRIGLPLIFTTSKTRTEVELLQEEMKIGEPFIVENGAAIYFPLGYRGWDKKIGTVMPPYHLIQLGKPYFEIRRFLERVRIPFGIRGFGDLTVREIAELAGMPEEKAKLAKEREFTEPFLIDKDGEIDRLQDLALKEDIKITKGGRFYHCIGAHQDKGEAVKITKHIFRQCTEGDVVFIGIGDSANDLPMLENVDIPVLIPHPDGSYEKTDLAKLKRAVNPGSKGWNEAVERILDDFERNNT